VRYIAKVFLVSALMVSIGAPWMLLQGVAWASMAVSYSRDAGSVGRGLAMTFDGQHGCKLCKAVEKTTQESKTPLAPEKSGGEKVKVEMCLSQRLRLPVLHSARLPHIEESWSAPARPECPDCPPPESRV